jgi:hypothetical protein
MMMNECRALGGIGIGRATRSTWRKPVLVATLSPTNDLACDRTGTTAVGSQRICYITTICIYLIMHHVLARDYFESDLLQVKTCIGKVTYFFTFSFM